MVSANHRTARTLAGDASTPTIHARFDMSTTLYFFLLFFLPLSFDAVSRDGYLPCRVSRHRTSSIHLSDATTSREKCRMNA